MPVRRLLLTAIGAIVLAAGAATPASGGHAQLAGCGGVQTASAQHRSGSRPPLAIGDSTMLLALPYLSRDGFDVNAHGCRQYPEALALLADLAHAGKLPHLVVIALGANGTIEPAEIEQALRTLGAGRILVLLTPRELGGGSGSDAQLVRAESRRHGERLVALDWVVYSAPHPQWFEPDGLHVNPTGAAAMSRLIATALPLATPPHAARVPRCQQAPPPANAPAGEQGAPASPELKPHTIRIDTHGSVLVVDPRSHRLRIPVLNSNAYALDGLARIERAGSGQTLLAAACFSVPPADGAQLEVPVPGSLVAGAKLLTRFKVRLQLDLFSNAAASTRIDASYVLRAGAPEGRPQRSGARKLESRQDLDCRASSEGGPR